MVEVYSVFQGGKWHEYEPSVSMCADPRITSHQMRLAAAAFVAAKQKGYTDTKAYALSDAVVFKHVYADLQYARDFEEEISALMGREGTA